jgi:hypothetical protein
MLATKDRWTIPSLRIAAQKGCSVLNFTLRDAGTVEYGFGVLRARTGAMTVRCLTLRYSHGADIMAVGGTGRPR